MVDGAYERSMRAAGVSAAPGVIVERLLDRGERAHTYALKESPLPGKEYSATIRVRPEGAGSIMEWEGKSEAAGVDEPQAVELMAGIYRAALDAL